ncbi:MAG: S8 family serine peptidase [Flavobacteriales bacterium]|nr:S8 family serine peptidase [Flavobacteriales bacterium]
MKNILTLTLLTLSLGSAQAQLKDSEYVPGNILVMLQPGGSVDAIVRDLALVDGIPTGLQVAHEVSAPMRAWLLQFEESAQTQWNMLRLVRSHPAVQLAQNDHVVKERLVPNDTQYNQQWHHQNIDSEAAWDISTGGVTITGDTIVVCIVENADLTHADLSVNAWVNAGEIPGNGIDDDGNGYIDDRRGWNTPSNNDNVYSGGHGTQCAGMVGATGNNGVGVVGANWRVKMMPVNYGGASESAVVAAYTYPLVMRRLYNSTDGERGAFVVATSASWGIDGGQPANSPMWCAMFDTLGTAGILNCGATANNAVNVDAVGDLPTACPSDFMISVTATNNNDQRTFSAWGLTTIDVGAPGESVRTTSIGGGYGNTSGTSFACPLTAGVIGLLYSAPCVSLMSLVHADPVEGALYVREKLFEGVEQVGNLPGNTVTGGRISSGNSMQLIMNSCSACPPPFSGVVQRNGTEATFTWNATTSGPFNVRYRPVGSMVWVDLPDVDENTVTVDGIDPCVAYEFQVEMICGGELSGYSNSVLLNPPAEGPPAITASGYPEFCAGVPFTLSSSIGTGITWSSGQQTTSISPQTSGAYTVTFNGQCGTYTSAPFVVTIIDPPGAPVADDVMLPGPGVATLDATGDNITWYNAATGGTAVGAGSPWDTPFLNGTTSFWCSAASTNGAIPSYGAKTDNSTSGVYHTNATNYQLFTANQTFVIRSVKVYANSAGNRPIALVNASGNTIAQGTFNIPNGESRVQLNFTVPGPGSYGLRIASGNPELWRDGVGSVQSYPYPLGTFGSMTSSSVAGSNGTLYYYFFYDWEVSLPLVSCEGPRVEVVVSMPVGITETGIGQVRLFPNPADRDLFLDINDPTMTGRLIFSVVDATGREVGSKTIENGRLSYTTAFLADGLYAYRILRNGEVVHAGRFLVEHLW